MAQRDAQPRVELVDAEWLGHVVVRAALERLDLLALLVSRRTGSRSASAASRLMRRTIRSPSISGRPRSSSTMSGRPASQRAQCAAAVGRLDEPVAAAAQRPDQRGARLVVVLDDEDACACSLGRLGHLRWQRRRAMSAGTSARGRSMSIARPPRSLRRASTSTAHRLNEATHDGEADARPRARGPRWRPGTR